MLAATIVPFYSELAVGAAVVAGYSPFLLWAVASAGNTLGAVINALLGRLLSAERARATFRLGERQYERACSWFQRYGKYSLLMSWLPVGGDALTVVAGALRVPWSAFLLLVFAGKATRYAVLIGLIVWVDG